MAIKTTTQSFYQYCVFHNDVDFTDSEVTFGKGLTSDGDITLNGSLLDGEGKEKFITTDLTPQEILIQPNNKDKVIFLNKEHTWNIALRYVNSTSYALTIGGTYYQTDRIYFQAHAMMFRRDKGGMIAFTSDISPLYAHTITINTPSTTSEPGGIICLTAYLTSNQPIDSIQDLCTICGNTDYQVSGFIFQGDAQALVKIHVGTSITDSSVTYVGSSGIINMKLSDTGVTSVSDSVTAVIAPISTASAKEDIWSDEEEMEGDEAEYQATAKAKKAKTK